MKKILIIAFILLMLVGCKSEVEEATQENIETEEVSAAVMLKRARSQLEANHENQAVALYARAHELSETGEAAYELSLYLYDTKAYEESLKFVKMALEREPENLEMLIHLGDCLDLLNRVQAAKSAYETVLNYDRHHLNASYRLGLIYLDEEAYEEALKYFKIAKRSLPDEVDILTRILDCYMGLEAYDHAYRLVQGYMREYPDTMLYYEYAEALLIAREDEPNLTKLYQNLLEQFPDNESIYYLEGSHYFDLGQYERAIAFFENLQQTVETVDLDLWCSVSYQHNGNPEKADYYVEKALKKSPEDQTALKQKAVLLQDELYYLEAVGYYRKVEALYPSIDSAIDLLRGLNMARRHQQAIDYGEAHRTEYGDNIDYLWQLSVAYYQHHEYEKAIGCYQAIMDIDPEMLYMMYDMADGYMQLGDIIQADMYLSQCLREFPEDEDVLGLKHYMDLQELPNDELISKLFNNLYYYEPNANGLRDLRPDMTDEELIRQFDEIKEQDDPYTFALAGDIYDETIEGLSELPFHLFGDQAVYVQIPFFDFNVDHLFIEEMDGLAHPEEMTLVIDLMQNSGGVTESAANILDVLLPEYQTVTLTYKDGSEEYYYSDASYTPFEEIIILVDEYTASSAEMLALGLSEYMDNVTIVGERTWGKGVGQSVFDDKVNKRLYFIVNHTWSINGENIEKRGIMPDLIKDRDEIKAYLETM